MKQPTPSSLRAVDLIGWACIVILKTIDGGNLWTLTTIGSPGDLLSVYFLNADTGYTVGQFGYFLKTVNGGTTWTGYPSYVNKDLNSVYFINNNLGFLACGDATGGKILESEDAGAHWVSWLTIPDPLYSLYFSTANQGWAVGGNGAIYKTVNGIVGWIPVASGITGTLKSVCFPDSVTGYSVGYNGTILKSMDAGNNWVVLPSGTNTNLTSVFFTDKFTGYAVGENGIILKTINGGVKPTTLTVVPQSRTVPSPIGNTYFMVYSGTNWLVSGDSSWLTFNHNGTGDDSLKISYSENKSFSERRAQLVIHDLNSDSTTVTLTQSAMLPQLEVSPANQNVTAISGGTTFSIKANDNWIAVSDSDWCQVTNSGIGNGTLTANFSANAFSNSRIANIEITLPRHPSTLKHVTVTQAGKGIGIPNFHDNEIQIYPNPTNGILTIETGSFGFVVRNVTINNMLGRTVLNEKLPDKTKFSFDLTDFLPGYYQLAFQFNNKTIIRKLIIMR